MVLAMLDYKQSLYDAKFKSQAKDTGILIRGLMNKEIRIRVAFRDQIRELAADDKDKIDWLFLNVSEAYFAAENRNEL